MLAPGELFARDDLARSGGNTLAQVCIPGQAVKRVFYPARILRVVQHGVYALNEDLAVVGLVWRHDSL